MAGGYVALAQFLLQSRRDLSEVKGLATRAAELEPIASNFFLLAIACQANQDADGAREAIQKAAELEPLNQEYQRFREYLVRQQ